MVDKKGTHLKKKGIAGTVFSYIFPAVFQSFSKWKYCKFFCKIHINLPYFFRSQLGSVSHELVYSNVKKRGQSGKHKDIRIGRARFPFGVGCFGYPQKPGQIFLGKSPLFGGFQLRLDQDGFLSYVCTSKFFSESNFT